MKKFLLYLVIAIAVVSLGLTIYYFSTDNEAIYIKSSYIVINVGDTIGTDNDNNELLDFKNRSEYTTLSYSAANVEVQTQENSEEEQDVLVYNENSHYFVANVGGKSRITITTNNRSYSRFLVDVLVCDGSEQYPFIVKTEDELRDNENARFNNEHSNYDYNLKLGNDIELTEEWTPIASYDKVFDGNFFTIKNMNITNASTRAGFVSVLETTGVIKNLFLEDVNIDCSVDYAGAFAGESHGLIQTSEATGVIKNNYTSSGTAYVGGIVGQMSSNTGLKTKIDRCGFEGEIETTGSNQTAGGIAGANQNGMISESYSRAFVKNNNNNFGGIVGLNQTTGIYTADIYDSYFYLTDKDSEATNTSKMKGIIYSHTDASEQNTITGNYYGGKIAATDVKLKPAAGRDIVSTANGYLTSVLGGEGVQFEQEASFVTAEYEVEDGTEKRYWNFDTVWSFVNDAHYPVLNVYSSVGSSYLIDVSNLTTIYNISTAQQLYDVLSDSSTTASYKIIDDISLDPNNAGGFVWGDSAAGYPIPGTFKGTIVNGTKDGRPCEIKDVTFQCDVNGQNVGLVQSLSSSAKMVGLVIKGVTFNASTVKPLYVGVVAGQSLGAHIYDVHVSNVTVNLSGVGFGGIVGYAGNYEGQGIENVSVEGVNASNAYYTFAGGLVGVNVGTITTRTGNANYNRVYSVQFVANSVGGVAGANGGKIYNTNAERVIFDVPASHEASATVYSGNSGVFVGGVAGANETTVVSTKYKGSISNVYANLICNAHTGAGYKLYIGGITGFNSNYVVRAYAYRVDVNVEGTQSAIVGGLVGYNTGRITNSIVDKDSKVVAPMISSVGETENYVMKTDNCSVVGGLVGYDAPTSNSTASLYQCATLANKIQGYYAGGLTAISLGKVEYCYCGDNTVANGGGVSISGHMIGGISAVIAGGAVKNCYTFCSLNAGSFNGATYKDLTSVLNMDVRSMGGISVFVLNSSTEVTGCYAVVSFSGNGVSYGSCADGYKGGKVTNCVYATAGSIKTSIGTQISKAKLQGSDGYKAFKKAIGNSSVWDFDAYTNIENEYPSLVGLNNRLPSDTLPTL